MKLFKLIWKLLRVAVHALRGFWTIKTVFPRLPKQEREDRVNVWAGQMMDIVGMTLQVRGAPAPSGPMLLVANHVSWLDILVMHASRYCRFISKADIQAWPIIGTLADGSGTLYVERESRRDAHRVVQQTAERLRLGDVLTVFPEGTTGDGITLKPFHANMIQAAIEAEAPIQPVAIRFLDAMTGVQSFAPRYVDDDVFIESVWRTLTAPPLIAVVVFGKPQFAEGRARREWAQALKTDIEALLDAGP